MHSSVYTGELMHNRLKPKKHRFSYRVASWLIDLDELDELAGSQRFFSRNRFNAVSFYDGDYGDGSDLPLKTQISRLLQQHGIDSPDTVRLLCYPRIMGYTFNPLAVYFCYSNGQLTAIVYEVSNTFKERHAYVASVDNKTQSNPSNELNQQFVVRNRADKQLHVSPFFPMNCYYHFRVKPPGEKISLGITLNNDEGKLFTAVFTGLHHRISDRFIVKQMLLLPMLTIKIVAAIHWEALRLWIKSISIFKHNPRGYFFSHSKATNSRATNSRATNSRATEERKL
ncbi:DUF1365 domain-containing protein [Endozoicomonas ascidiicola]|uniref:DUF1365 domain-containing protein n=1 Tax=Endozoicomonas ascidiicola TaxID=1698521 RepID=UPI00082CFB9D|nr:DUF1365 domain-containing protein [Endozoicomonas ascidiicola]